MYPGKFSKESIPQNIISPSQSKVGDPDFIFSEPPLVLRQNLWLTFEMDPIELNQRIETGMAYLQHADPVMKKLILETGPVRIIPPEKKFPVLVSSVISQLISTKAANTVYSRLEHYTEGKIEPEVLLKISKEDFRSFGIGNQKYGYIRSISEVFAKDPDYLTKLNHAEDDEALKALISLKGIGKWTAQMFLIFGLGRLDIFAPDDLGLRYAMEELYEWEMPPTRKMLNTKAEIWAPYRSVASLYLWRSRK